MPTKKFLHLMPAERKLWEIWLLDHESDWLGYEYDVHVGDGIPLKDDWPNNIKVLAKMITQKRIDVTAWKDKTLWIFEVKPHAALSALGQLLAYRHFYRKTFSYEGPLEIAVVTDIIYPDERWLFEKENINIFIVTP